MPKPSDGKPVWSIAGFFIRRGARRRGMMARPIDAYPKPVAEKTSSRDLHVGTPGAFRRGGFDVATRPSPVRVVIRKRVDRNKRTGRDSVCRQAEL